MSRPSYKSRAVRAVHDRTGEATPASAGRIPFPAWTYSRSAQSFRQEVLVHGDFLCAGRRALIVTASPNTPHDAVPAHTARGSLCLRSWAARAACRYCSLQPAPSMLLCLSDHSAAHTASRCCRLHRRDCSGTDRSACSDSDDICRFRGHRRRGSLPQLPHCEAFGR